MEHRLFFFGPVGPSLIPTSYAFMIARGRIMKSHRAQSILLKQPVYVYQPPRPSLMPIEAVCRPDVSAKAGMDGWTDGQRDRGTDGRMGRRRGRRAAGQQAARQREHGWMREPWRGSRRANTGPAANAAPSKEHPQRALPRYGRARLITLRISNQQVPAEVTLGHVTRGPGAASRPPFGKALPLEMHAKPTANDSPLLVRLPARNGLCLAST